MQFPGLAMPLTKPKSKTYSNPSWTMAILAAKSPLARWWGKSLEQVSDFRLNFHPEEVSSNQEDGNLARAVVVQGNQAQLESLSQLTESYIQTLLVQSVTNSVAPTSHSLAITTTENDVAFPGDVPEWQVDSTYCHRLYLGSLQVEPLMSELTVTTSQLHDLSEILHEALRSVQPQIIREFPARSLSWPKTAAAAVVAVGLTGGVTWYITGGSVFQTASESDQDLVSLETPESSAPAQDNEVDLPPTFQAKPIKPTTPKSDAEADKLPTTRKPNTVLTTPSELGDTPSDRDAAPTSQKNNSVTGTRSPGVGNPQPSVEKPASSDAASTTDAQSTVGQTEPASKAAESDGSTEQALSDESQQNTASTVDAEQSGNADEVTEPVAAAPRSNQPASFATPPPSPSPLQEGLSAARREQRSVVQGASRASAEVVLTFFQSQWRGQESLEQSLSYRIEVQPDGTVKSVTPQNNLASAQIEQTPIPPAGASLIAPFAGSSPMLFDVTLYPDGTVSVK